MKWPWVSRRIHELEVREWRSLSDQSHETAKRSNDQAAQFVQQYIVPEAHEQSALRAEANMMLGWLASLRSDVANRFGPYFVDGKATTRAERDQIRASRPQHVPEPIHQPAREEAPALSPEQYTVAVGRVPNRSDGVMTLHVGPCWVMLSPGEARKLSGDLLSLSCETRS